MNTSPNPTLLTVENVKPGGFGGWFRKVETPFENVSFSCQIATCTAILVDNEKSSRALVSTLMKERKPVVGKVTMQHPSGRKSGKSTKIHISDCVSTAAGLSLREHIVLQLAHAGVRPRRFKEVSTFIEATWKQCGIEGNIHSDLSHLSIAAVRMAELTSAVFCIPNLMVVEQPFASLPESCRTVLDGLFTKLIGQGTALIVLARDTHDIPECAQQIFQLNKSGLQAVSADAVQQEPLYEIRVNGFTKSAVQQLAGRANLPAPESVNESGFVTSLSLRSYPSASTWLAQLLSAGAIILQFRELGRSERVSTL